VPRRPNHESLRCQPRRKRHGKDQANGEALRRRTHYMTQENRQQERATAWTRTPSWCRCAVGDSVPYRATPTSASVWRGPRRQWRRRMVGARRCCSVPDRRGQSAAGELSEGLGEGRGGGDGEPAASIAPRPQQTDRCERLEAAGGCAFAGGIGRVDGPAVAAVSDGGGAAYPSRGAAATPGPSSGDTA